MQVIQDASRNRPLMRENVTGMHLSHVFRANPDPLAAPQEHLMRLGCNAGASLSLQDID
jgi:hypothetical protein